MFMLGWFTEGGAFFLAVQMQEVTTPRETRSRQCGLKVHPKDKVLACASDAKWGIQALKWLRNTHRMIAPTAQRCSTSTTHTLHQARRTKQLRWQHSSFQSQLQGSPHCVRCGSYGINSISTITSVLGRSSGDTIQDMDYSLYSHQPPSRQAKCPRVAATNCPRHAVMCSAAAAPAQPRHT